MDQLDKFIDAQQKVGERLDLMFSDFLKKDKDDNLFMSESKKTEAYFENKNEKYKNNNAEIVFGHVRPIVETLVKFTEQ